MGKGNPGKVRKGSIKTFNPERYGMGVCPECNSTGYVQNPNHQCCPKCGGFGYIRKEGEGACSVFLSPDDLEKK
jgi:ferredoxin-thioredoxin reductase catalytic subunit